MKDVIKITAWTVFAALLICLFGWLFTANNLALMQIFAPRQEQVRRETFEQSKAYQQGMIQELENMQFEYIRADPKQKAALASIIRHRAAGVPRDVLTPELYQFIKELP
jgi:hypothetical protein